MAINWSVATNWSVYPSGVIQGSVIGPLMFLIYINDLIVLLSQYSIKLKLFADDVKLYVKIVNNIDYVSALAAWADEWQLSVSIDKCGVLYVGKGVCSAPQQFKLHDSPLPIVSCYHDLGITITSNLAFSTHINNIVKKSY